MALGAGRELRDRHRTPGRSICPSSQGPLPNTPMASIRIPFPDKDEPGVVLLQGPRVTVGRLPFNTLQIIDRTVSGFHAELILDGGHYRLHDRGSTNGTFVNGTPATDFHLCEACQISFGTVECAFDPAEEAVGTGEAVPTREEVNSVRAENAKLHSTLAAVREAADALRESKPGGPAGEGVAREEFTKVVAEREVLRETQTRLEQEVARLKGVVAVLQRDRENLQKAWDATKAELARAAGSAAAQPSAERPVCASAPPTAEAVVEQKVAPPVCPAPPVPLSRPAVPVTPPAVAPPVAQPAISVAAPTVRSFPQPQPAVPVPRLFPVTAAPAQTSSGVRPFPRVEQPPDPAASTPRPVLAPKPPTAVLQPRASVMPSHPPVQGPKGTQKIG